MTIFNIYEVIEENMLNYKIPTLWIDGSTIFHPLFVRFILEMEIHESIYENIFYFLTFPIYD